MNSNRPSPTTIAPTARAIHRVCHSTSSVRFIKPQEETAISERTTIQAGNQKRTAPQISSLFFIAALFLCSTAARAADKPNIVFMLADDLGWRDTTPYGSTFYETPNIAHLAAKGMRFTNAYAASPLCSPTRASILTGQYPGRLRLTAPAGHSTQVILDPQVPDTASPHSHVTIPETRTRLPNNYVTYAEVLKQAGYQTAFVGKWHLGRDPYLPDNQGFDVVVGGREHSGPPGGFFAPWPIDTIPAAPEGSHIDDVITTEAIKFIETNRDQPFLLNLWFYSVHSPYEAKEPLIEKYRKKATADPDNLQTNSIMGGMIETLDDNVGRVMETLERLDLIENTLIVFTSDNGGNEYNLPEGVEATNNDPLRNGKGNIYEGGQRVPLIVSWPDKIAEGVVNSAVVTSVDYYPTILEITGRPHPEPQLCDGISLWSLLLGSEVDPLRAAFCHFPHSPPATGTLPATSVRRGDWKLLRFFGDGPDQANRLELYDLSEDAGETQNMAAEHANIAAELDGLIEENLKQTESLVPKPNPNYQPSARGWIGNKDASLKRQDGFLQIESTGNDPWISTSSFPRVVGQITVDIRMKAEARGEGAVYVATDKHPSFARERRAMLQIQHDGQWHTYRTEFILDGRLKGLRVDPASGAGTLEIAEIRLIAWQSPDLGRCVSHWDF